MQTQPIYIIFLLLYYLRVFQSYYIYLFQHYIICIYALCFEEDQLILLIFDIKTRVQLDHILKPFSKKNSLRKLIKLIKNSFFVSVCKLCLVGMKYERRFFTKLLGYSCFLNMYTTYKSLSFHSKTVESIFNLFNFPNLFKFQFQIQ